MQSPLKTIYVTTKFGVSGSQWQFGKHMGVDLRASVGTPLYAPEAGKINERYVGSSGIKVLGLAGTKWHRFLHLDKFMVGVGDTIKAGQLIGYTGNTGDVAAHLHWDVRKPNTVWSASFSNYYDPLSLITEEDMLTRNQVRDLFVALYGRGPSDAEYEKYIGKTTYEKLRANMLASDKFAGLIQSASQGKLNPVNHLTTPLKKVYVAPPPPTAQTLGAGLYNVN